MTRGMKNPMKPREPAWPAAVAKAVTINQKSTGRRPKCADNITEMIPPAPTMNWFPDCEWLTTSGEISYSLGNSCVNYYLVQIRHEELLGVVSLLRLQNQGCSTSDTTIIW
jgi:hypothetical protein